MEPCNKFFDCDGKTYVSKTYVVSISVTLPHYSVLMLVDYLCVVIRYQCYHYIRKTRMFVLAEQFAQDYANIQNL